MRLPPSTRGVCVLIALLMALTAWTTIRETHRWRKAPFADFNHLQTGAECLVAGCDPYDFAALNREGVRRHEQKPYVWPMTPVYPASSHIVVLPFEGLGWPLAAWVFNGLSGLLTATACAMMVWWMRIRPWDPAALVLVAGLISIPIAAALEFANPALLDAALIAIACLLLLREQQRYERAGWILLGIALALKPQLAAGAAAVLLWLPQTRRAAFKAWALSFALLVIGLASFRLRLGSFHFLATLHWALQLAAMPAGSSDYANNEAYDFLNLELSLAAIPHLSRTAITSMAWATTTSLAAISVWVGLRRQAILRRPWTMIALATGISLLPVYHRGYDRVIALVLAPAAIELGLTRKPLAWLYAACVTLWLASDTLMSHILKRWHYAPQNPVEGIVICLVLLVSLAGLPRPEPPSDLVASKA